MSTTTPKIHSGYFIIADITGYTSFLSGTELDHAQAILEELTKLLLGHIKPPLKLVKLEGDAVFYYTPVERMPEAERILDHIESCYFDFISHVRDMEHATNCPCRACSSMHTLDLKFFVHYGEFMIQKLPGTAEDIIGPDVILLHRLLKNNVCEKTGLQGYALLTNACLEKMGAAFSTIPHSETCEHIGIVDCGVYDLHAYERLMNASPDQLWSFIVDPEQRYKWQVIKTVKNIPNSSGRMGVDAEFHCDHGSFNRTTHMMDWRPFNYMTNTTVQTFHKIPLKSPPALVTFELLPVDSRRTKLSVRMRSLRRDWFTMLFIRLFMKRAFDKENNFEYERLDKVLAELNEIG